MRRRSLPVDFEGFVQRSQMRLEVRLNAAIRIGPAHDGENGKQQYVRQPIEFALGATRVRDCGEQRQKRLQGLQGLQGDLPSIRSPHTDSDFFAPRNRPLRLSHQELENCCIWDSVESVEQPWATRAVCMTTCACIWMTPNARPRRLNRTSMPITAASRRGPQRSRPISPFCKRIMSGPA